MTDKPSPNPYEGVSGAEKIALEAADHIVITEGHLGGYVGNGAAPGTWCPVLWDWAYDKLGVRSVLDIGCGLGYAARHFRDRGCRVRGVDGSPSAILNSQIKDDVVQHDFTTGPYVTSEDYDLVWSAEFVEHVEEKYSGNFLLGFARARKFVMLTYAKPGQGGHHHVNEQPQEYWIERLAAIGFDHDERLTKAARRRTKKPPIVGMHFRRRGLVFRRR